MIRNIGVRPHHGEQGDEEQLCAFLHAVLRREGIRKGRQEGIEETRREVAVRMKKRGAPIGQIAEDTGLSIEDIAVTGMAIWL